MNKHAGKIQRKKSKPADNTSSEKNSGGEATSQFNDNRPETIMQRKLNEIANNSPQVNKVAQLQTMANSYAATIQKKENKTGLPDHLKSGIENMSGHSMDDVKVHYNSDKPSQLQAHAYAQGTDIHLAPGQEKHLPHEAWHVVQQKQGRVKPTRQLKSSVPVNDNPALEKEADVMGAMALGAGKATGKGTLIQSKKVGAVQLREDNPYASAQSHDDWELTAHHIVAHSKLTEAYALLTVPQQRDILQRSIPAVLNKSILNNVKVVVPDNADAHYYSAIRARLVNMADNAPVENTNINNIRESFFEWQQGNQFSGPNTSIRTEPSSEKSDMDTDGKYFSDEGNFANLHKEGKKLYGHLATTAKLKEEKSTLEKAEAPDAGKILANQQALDASQAAIYNQLKAILAVTVNVSNEDFDPNKWHEIGTLQELISLAKNKDLNRSHLLKYAFFKIPVNQTRLNAPNGPQKYDKLHAENAGNSEFSFGNIARVQSQAKGTNLFIPIEQSKREVPSAKVNRTARDVFGKLGIHLTAVQLNSTAAIPAKLIAFKNKNIIRLNNYEGTIPYTSEAANVYTFTPVQLNAVLSETVLGESLYEYLSDKGAPTSSYLPKALYDKINKISLLKDLKSKASIKLATSANEVSRIARLKPSTARQASRLAKRSQLFSKKHDDAIIDIEKYDSAIAEIRNSL